MPSYDGMLVCQRSAETALPLFVFAATAKEVLQWARILRTVDARGAAQRRENLAHIRSIQSYIGASPDNVIPTAVTVALDAGRFNLKPSPGGLTKPCVRMDAQLEVSAPAGDKEDEKPGFVIDGQHRLIALSKLQDDSRLLVTAILGASSLDRALHFVVINNKAKRVPSDLVQGIVAELPPVEQTSIKQRLVAVGLTLGTYPSALEVLGVHKDSPFVGIIDWDINRTGVRRVRPPALENSLRAILANLRAPEKLDIDDAVDLCSAMWRGVRDSWTDRKVGWASEQSRLLDKASIVAVTEFLIERMNIKIEEGFDSTDLELVQDYCKEVMSTVPVQFWLVEWRKKELDTSAGRSLIRQSLAEVRRAVASNWEDPLSYAPLLKSSAEEDP